MKKTTSILIAFIGFAVALQSCSKHHDDQTYAMSNQDFVTQASSSNSFEIAAGGLAKSKGVNANVVAYGNHMVTDHSKAAAEMTILATQKGLTVNNTMLAQEQTNLNTLNSLSGTAFDIQFAAMMVASHQKTIALFESASQNNGMPDGDLRAFAAGKLPELKMHLSDAQSLQAQVSGH